MLGLNSYMVGSLVFLLFIVALALDMFSRNLCSAIDTPCNQEDVKKMQMSSAALMLVAAVLVLGSFVMMMMSKNSMMSRGFGRGFGSDLFGFEFA